MRYTPAASHAAPALMLFCLLASCIPWLSVRAATTGEQRTAVILVNFQDNPSQPISRADAHALVFGTVSDFYWEASYQKTFLAGDTYGYYTLPVSSGSCAIDLITQEADRQAATAGVDLSGYERLIYLMPNTACTGAGYNSGAKLPSRLWINSDNITAQSIAHELGHNFGLLHAQSLDCGAAVLDSDCASNVYGDPADVMGSGTLAHFDSVHKEKLGWLGGAGQPAIASVSASGRYLIAPIEVAGNTAVRAIKIPRGIDPNTGQPTYYYVEYRQPLGFDAGLANIGNLATGVLVHLGGSGQRSELLDMTPDSYPTSAFNDMRDAALLPGRSYSDAATATTIKLVSADANGALVDVLLGSAPAPTCTPATPVLSLIGGGTSVAAGTPVTYTITLGNRDGAGCAATTFSLARSVPNGWVGTLSTGSLTLSPGASANAVLTVTSGATSTAGSYAIGVGTGSDASSMHTTTASAMYSVGAALPAPTTSVATDKTGYVRGETVYMSARVLDGGVPVAGAAVRFTVRTPTGTAALAGTTGTDGYARAALKLGKGKSAVGSYALRAEAGGGIADSAFTVR